MQHYINRERLAVTFTTLCEISSPSRKEGALANYLRQTFAELGADALFEDDSQAATGANCGNLLIRFQGNQPEQEGMFLSCHMDTVQPGEGVKVIRNGDLFTSRDNTILGSDDKSGIAAIIELLQVLKEQRLGHGLIEVVLTTCEEIGLLGAKHFDHTLVSAPYGYALDSDGIDTVIYGAPAANKVYISITGAAAHAGLNPEQGVSAIQIAAAAIAKLKLGRIDHESTANLGLISGGVATNIIPESVSIEGEVRSHSSAKLAAHTATIQNTFQDTVDQWPAPATTEPIQPQMRFQIEPEYPAMRLAADEPVLMRLVTASEQLAKPLTFKIAGGGSDANIFNSFGLPTAIIATGMSKVHTTEEQLALDDLVSLTELLLGLATVPTGEAVPPPTTKM